MLARTKPSPLGVMLALVVFNFAASVVPAMAGQFTGSINSTLGTGTVVNLNQFASKDLVYLNGGPQNMQSMGLPDGTYYFQVTDPSGGTLLSDDPAVCRQVKVVGGVIAHSFDGINTDTGGFTHALGAF